MFCIFVIIVTKQNLEWRLLFYDFMSLRKNKNSYSRHLMWLRQENKIIVLF